MIEPKIEKGCSIISALNILSRKWILFILTELMTEYETKKKGMYFSELQKQTKDKYGTKISSRVLSDSLHNLESEGLISRNVEDLIPVRVSYSLTEKGDDFKVVLSALKGWGVKYGHNINKKLCLNFSCLHNAVPILNIEKAWDLMLYDPKLDDIIYKDE